MSQGTFARQWRAYAGRMLAGIIATALVVAGVGAGASAAPRFSDVKSTDAFAKEISWLASSGVTTGYADGTFRPKDNISREAMAAFMYRLAGSPKVTLPRSSPFVDVPRTAQFYDEIVWLAQQGISTGWSDGTFRPKDNISREAMAAFMYRYAKSGAHWGDTEIFEDVSWSHQFYDEIDWLAQEGITTGYSTGYGCREYRPKDPVTREAMAAFLYRLETGSGTPLYSSSCNPPAPVVPTKPADKDCADFATQAQAQAWYLKYYPYYGDFARLDGDNDGRACDLLP